MYLRYLTVIKEESIMVREACQQADSAERSHLSYRGSRESEQEVGQGHKSLKPAPNDVLSPSRLYLLKIPYSPPTAPITRDHVSKCMRISHFSNSNQSPTFPGSLSSMLSACSNLDFLYPISKFFKFLLQTTVPL